MMPNAPIRSRRGPSAALFIALALSTAPAAAQNAATPYSEEEISYFFEIALGTEFGGSVPQIKKWVSDVRIGVFGAPTPQDRSTLSDVIAEINGLTGGLELALVEEDPDIEIYFVPESEFAVYEPNYTPTNLGFFWVWWNNACEIFQARIMISTEGVTQRERSHLIREELTQSLGLMRDSTAHPESIFYQIWTDTDQYADLDRAVLSLLYHPEILPGMDRPQAEAVISGLRRGPVATGVAAASWGGLKQRVRR